MSDLWSDFLSSLSCFTDGKTSVNDLNYAIHVSLKYRYVFVETPKVACSTIKMTLQRLELESPEFEREDFEDLHRREFSPLLSLQQLPNFERFFEEGGFFVFCFVRNPYNRLLSCYLDKIKNPVDSTKFKEKVLKTMGVVDNIAYPVSFEEFVAAIELQTPLEMDYHWRPQSYLTCQSMINYDFIGRLESFVEDFYFVGSKLSPEFNRYYLPEVRHQTDANKVLDKYYSDELYERVYNLYRIDFENFSYDC